MGKHNEFGKLGEQMAVDFLMECGYKVRARNYRYQKAEIDIVASKDAILAIVEVKSRNQGFVKDLNDVIDKKKVALLVLAADHYVIENNLDVEVRFDLITVIKKNTEFEVKHVKNAYYFF